MNTNFRKHIDHDKLVKQIALAKKIGRVNHTRLPKYKYSVVILNFNRPDTVKTILDKFVTFDAIDKIIVSNGKKETEIIYEHNKVDIKNDAGNNQLHGLDLRFLRMLDCHTEHVIIIDDDIIIEEQEINKILVEYENNTDRIVGCWGRNIGEKMSYNFINRFNQVDIILTKLLVCRKNLGYLFFYCKPLIEHIYKNGVPYGNGEDIFFSFVTNLLYDKKHLAISGINKKDLGDDDVAVSNNSAHVNYRTQLCKFLYSNKAAFKEHIKDFKFPRYYEEDLIKQKIFRKEEYILNKTKSKNLVLTMSLGENRNLLELTEMSMKIYADRVSADYLVLTDESPFIINNRVFFKEFKSGRKYGKDSYLYKVFAIYYYLEKYDKILWLDDSCYVCRMVGNIFTEVNDGSIGAYNEGCIKEILSYKFDKEFIESKNNFVINTEYYINSGVVVYTKQLRYLFSLQQILKHKNLFESKYPHQAFLNYIIQSNYVTQVMFSNKYNDMLLHYNYDDSLNKRNLVDKEYVEKNNSNIFHITGWWPDRFSILTQITEHIGNKAV